MSPRLAALNGAVLSVDAGHGDVDALGAAAPGLVSAARGVRTAAKGHPPCAKPLVKAAVVLSSAAGQLSSAGQQLERLVAAFHQGKDSSGPEGEFLGLWHEGAPRFQRALLLLRVAGVPGLVRATDGKGVFTEAGCGMCHTLAAAGATSTIGSNFDFADSAPSRSAVVNAVTNGSGVMISFKGTLTAEQIKAVAEFVAQNAGK